MSSFGYYEAYDSEYEELLKAQVEIKIDEIWNKIKEPLKGVKDFYDRHQSSFISSTKNEEVAKNLVDSASLDELIDVYKNVEKVREGFTGQTINYIVIRSKLLVNPNAKIPYAKLQNYEDWINNQKGGLQREIGIVTVDDLIIDKATDQLRLSPEGIRTAVQKIQSNKVIQELDKRSKKIEEFVQNTDKEYGVFFTTVNYNSPKGWNIKDTDSDNEKIRKFNKYYKDKKTYQDLNSAYGFEHDSVLQTLYNAGNGGNREEFYYEFHTSRNILSKPKDKDVCYGIKKSKNELIKLPRTNLGRLEEFYLREAARTINEKQKVQNNLYVGNDSDNVDKLYSDSSSDKIPFYQDGDLMVYDYSNGKSVSHVFQVKADDSGIKIATLCAIIKSIYSVFELYNNNISWRNLKNREQLIRIFIKDKESLKLEELYKELREDQQEIYNRIDDFISSVLLFN